VDTARHLQDFVRAKIGPRQHVLAALHDVGVARVVDHDRVETPDIECRLASRGHREQERTFDQTVKKRPYDAYRLAAVIEGGGEVGPPIPKFLRDLLYLSAGGHEHRHAATFPQHPFYETIVQELEWLFGEHIDLRRSRRIKCVCLQDLAGGEVVLVEARIDCGGEPNEAAPGALTEGETQLHLGGRLVDLVYDQRVLRGDQAILEPTARDTGRDDHDIPGRRLGGGFSLTIDDSHFERRLQNRLGHAPNRQRLPGPGAGHNPEPLTRAGEAANVVAMLPLEQRLQLQAQRQLDCFAGGARRCNDDHSPSRRLSSEECLGIRGEGMVAGYAHC